MTIDAVRSGVRGITRARSSFTRACETARAACRFSLLRQEGHAQVGIEPGWFGVLSGFGNDGPPVCVMTKGAGALGLSRHTLLDESQ